MQSVDLGFKWSQAVRNNKVCPRASLTCQIACATLLEHSCERKRGGVYYLSSPPPLGRERLGLLKSNSLLLFLVEEGGGDNVVGKQNSFTNIITKLFNLQKERSWVFETQINVNLLTLLTGDWCLFAEGIGVWPLLGEARHTVKQWVCVFATLHALPIQHNAITQLTNWDCTLDGQQKRYAHTLHFAHTSNHTPY